MNSAVNIFTPEQRARAEAIINSPYSSLKSLNSTEIKELAIVWCYYSARIEGNTYTYVETEALLKDNITSSKRYEDAKMLKNLYNTFVSQLRYIFHDGNREVIDERLLLRIHRLITAELVPTEESGKIRERGVRISGTEYTPPKSSVEIRHQLAELFHLQETIENPIERAIFLHCHIAKLQPFIDGNKRTSRMVESIVLINDGIIPIYSTRDSDILDYRQALVNFYESGDYSEYVEYLLLKQEQRIESIL